VTIHRLKVRRFAQEGVDSVNKVASKNGVILRPLLNNCRNDSSRLNVSSEEQASVAVILMKKMREVDALLVLIV